MSQRKSLLLKRRVFSYPINEAQWTKLSNLCTKYPEFYFVPFRIHGQLTAYVVLPPAPSRWTIYGEIAQIMKSDHPKVKTPGNGVVDDARGMSGKEATPKSAINRRL